MTNIKYPDIFPLMRLSGLSTNRNSSVIRTEMDAGPKKQRRRYTISSKNFSGTILLSSEQRTAFEVWYKNTLSDGVLRFAMKDPQTLQLCEFRFTEDYDENFSEGLWEISMKLEKMNA